MTANPYPHAAQKAARRGVLSSAGSKRVEVVLDADACDVLQKLQKDFGGASKADVIKRALWELYAPEPGHCLGGEP